VPDGAIRVLISPDDRLGNVFAGIRIKHLQEAAIRGAEFVGGVTVSEESVNIYSRAADPVGRLLSNFAPTPFELDGLRYGSVEGFYSSLFWPEGSVDRARTAAMSGVEAKRSRPTVEQGSAPQPVLSYGGHRFAVRSPLHRHLYERAIRAKVAANPVVADALARTGDRVLTHKVRGRDADPALCAIYTQIRTELHAGGVPRVPVFQRGQTGRAPRRHLRDAVADLTGDGIPTWF
jgi:hypothetical protein